mmetsp:Transcript_33115/g.92764  ORF Transcript_33115/g.92764 Transcript_33115/m.92764 type:complete len:298 (-) Transcript_33115:3447-4340(-)
MSRGPPETPPHTDADTLARQSEWHTERQSRQRQPFRSSSPPTIICWQAEQLVMAKNCLSHRCSLARTAFPLTGSVNDNFRVLSPPPPGCSLSIPLLEGLTYFSSDLALDGFALPSSRSSTGRDGSSSSRLRVPRMPPSSLFRRVCPCPLRLFFFRRCPRAVCGRSIMLADLSGRLHSLPMADRSSAPPLALDIPRAAEAGRFGWSSPPSASVPRASSLGPTMLLPEFCLIRLSMRTNVRRSSPLYMDRFSCDDVGGVPVPVPPVPAGAAPSSPSELVSVGGERPWPPSVPLTLVDEP